MDARRRGSRLGGGFLSRGEDCPSRRSSDLGRLGGCIVSEGFVLR